MTDKFEMAGTQGTGDYVVLATTARGRVGVRVLEGHLKHMNTVASARIRVEPIKTDAAKRLAGEHLTSELGWKQPGDDGQHRFSIVTDGGAKGKKFARRVMLAMKAIGVGTLKTEMNPKNPAWVKGLV